MTTTTKVATLKVTMAGTGVRLGDTPNNPESRIRAIRQELIALSKSGRVIPARVAELAHEATLTFGQDGCPANFKEFATDVPYDVGYLRALRLSWEHADARKILIRVGPNAAKAVRILEKKVDKAMYEKFVTDIAEMTTEKAIKAAAKAITPASTPRAAKEENATYKNDFGDDASPEVIYNIAESALAVAGAALATLEVCKARVTKAAKVSQSWEDKDAKDAMSELFAKYNSVILSLGFFAEPEPEPEPEQA